MARKSTPARLLNVIRPLAPPAPGIFSVSTRKRIHYYAFQEVPCTIGGRGFAVHRLDKEELYHVRVGTPHECSCECLGFLRHGNCKHLAAMRALIDNGTA